MSSLNWILVGIGVFFLFLFLPVTITLGKKLLGKREVFPSTPGSGKNLLPHLLIGGIVVGAGYLIWTNYELGLWHKVILGFGLMWVGGKMAQNSAKLASVWGKVLRMLGIALLLVTALQEGPGMMAEKVVTSGNNSLKELATGQPSQDSGTSSGWFEGGLGGKEISLNLRHLDAGGNQVVTMSPSDTVVPMTRMARLETDGNLLNVACPTVVAPEHLAGKIHFHIPYGAFTDTPEYEMTDESKLIVIKSGLNKVRVKFTVTKSAVSQNGESECLYLKHPAR